MTLRQCIESGGRGDFAYWLLKFYDVGTLNMLANALLKADMDNEGAMLRALPGDVIGIATVVYMQDGGLQERLCQEWPGLRLLDEETDNPHAIVLRGEKTDD